MERRIRARQRIVKEAAGNIKQIARLHVDGHQYPPLRLVDHRLGIGAERLDRRLGTVLVNLPDLLALQLDGEHLMQVAMAIEGTNTLERAIDVRPGSRRELRRQ